MADLKKDPDDVDFIVDKEDSRPRSVNEIVVEIINLNSDIKGLSVISDDYAKGVHFCAALAHNLVVLYNRPIVSVKLPSGKVIEYDRIQEKDLKLIKKPVAPGGK